MTVLAVDNFNRANANPMGSPWSTGTSEGAMQIVSNAATFASNVDSSAFYSTISWPNDQYSKAKLTVTGTTGGLQGACLNVRHASGALTCYRLGVNHAATNNVEVDKIVAGVFTPLAGFPLTQAWTDGDTWELRAVGTTISVYLNGVLVASATDNAIASGSPGIGYSTTATAITIDDWEGGSVGETPAPVLAQPKGLAKFAGILKNVRIANYVVPDLGQAIATGAATAIGVANATAQGELDGSATGTGVGNATAAGVDQGAATATGIANGSAAGQDLGTAAGSGVGVAGAAGIDIGNASATGSGNATGGDPTGGATGVGTATSSGQDLGAAAAIGGGVAGAAGQVLDAAAAVGEGVAASSGTVLGNATAVGVGVAGALDAGTTNFAAGAGNATAAAELLGSASAVGQGDAIASVPAPAVSDTGDGLPGYKSAPWVQLAPEPAIGRGAATGEAQAIATAIEMPIAESAALVTPVDEDDDDLEMLFMLASIS